MKKSEKTVILLNEAFKKLIENKDYSEITIQDILNESGVSRSAFYLHFKTKDELLLSYSEHLFHHVFSHVLEEEKTHNFSNALFYDYKSLITHIFYHVLDEKELFKGMMKSKSNTLFLNEIRKNIRNLVDSYYNNYSPKSDTVPMELKKTIMVESFISVTKYWIDHDFNESPEEIGNYYFTMLKNS